jgi:phosphatidate cytidylyltransferase
VTGTRTLPDKNSKGAESQKPEVGLRVASALVLAAIALGAAIASSWTFALLVVVSSVIVAWEWGRVVRSKSFDGITMVEAVGVAALVILVTLGRPDLALIALAASVAVIGFVGLASNALGWSIAGLAYAALPAWALVWLRSDQAFGAIAVLYLFAIAWTTDTASYAAGRLIGGPKLAPRISPHKTWSGFIIGALAPALVGYAFALTLGDTRPFRLAAVSVVLALACQAGDLLESAVKRRFGAKDMSQLIPGHGGLLDRIDGLLAAALLASLIALRDPASPGRALLIW